MYVCLYQEVRKSFSENFVYILNDPLCRASNNIMKTTILLDYSFSADAKFSEKLKFLACSYQGVRNVSFSENFAYVLNEWPLCKASNNIMKTTCITTENAAKASFITSKNKRTNCVLWRPFLISHVPLISK